MELVNEFRVDLPVQQTWELLTDVERIAPCMPGAELLGTEGEHYLGAVKVKVGPITAQYKGKASFEEKDAAAGRAVIRAEGRETRGQGSANALITVAISEDGSGSAVSVSTDLSISGKAAQFGRGVLADVSSKLLQQFVSCLEASVQASNAAPAEAPAAAAESAPAPAPAPSAPSAPPAPQQAAAPVNLIGTVAGPVLKRVGPFVALAVIAYLLGRLARRRG